MQLVVAGALTVAVIIGLIMIITTAIGSRTGLSKEERQLQTELREEYLAVGEEAMEKYLKEKYGKEMDVYDVEIPVYKDIISGKSTGIYKAFAYGKVKCDGKLHDVCVDIDSDNACYDNIQREEIYNAFKVWLIDALGSQPYYCSVDIGAELEEFESKDGMTNVMYDGDIERFITSGGIESIIAFVDKSDVLSASNKLDMLLNTDYALVVTTNERRFGAIEAENIRFRDMRDFYVPYIAGFWECRLGQVTYSKHDLRKIGEALYLADSDNVTDIAISEMAAPTECLKALDERTDVKKVSLWYYVMANEAILYFHKDQIPGYDENKEYCVFAAISQNETGHELKILQVDELGEYLAVKCPGLESWYALCECVDDGSDGF